MFAKCDFRTWVIALLSKLPLHIPSGGGLGPIPSLPGLPCLRSPQVFDFVIVGGGTSGCVLASRISEVPGVSVLLLERGGKEPFEARVPAFVSYVLGTAVAEIFQVRHRYTPLFYRRSFSHFFESLLFSLNNSVHIQLQQGTYMACKLQLEHT